MLTVSILAIWVERNVIDGPEFADRSVALLDSAAVRDELAQRITDELIANGAASLSSFRSTVVSLVEDVTQTQAFRLVFRKAVLEAHDDIFEKGDNRASLDLADTLNILASVADGADRAAPTSVGAPTTATPSTTTPSTTTPSTATPSTATPSTAAPRTTGDSGAAAPGPAALVDPALALLKQLPASVQTLSVDEAPVLEHLRLWRMTRNLRWLAIVAPLLTLVAAATAIVVGRPRRHMVLELGVGMAAAGLAIVVVCEVIPRLVTDELGDPGLAAATRTAVERFLADLRAIGIWSIPLGVLLAAAATTSGAPHLGTRLRDAWHSLVAGPGTRGSPTSVLKGAALLLVGILAIPYRETLLPLAVGVVGAGVAYTGAVILLNALLGPVPAGRHAARRATAEDGAAGHGVRTSGVLVASVVGLALAVVVVIGLFTGVTRARDHARQSATHLMGCNGFVQLCSRRLDQVAFAGAHNAMSAADSPGWLFAENLHGIPSQLEYGIRALLVKSHYGIPTGVSANGAELVITDETAEAVNNPTDKTEELPEDAIVQAEALEQTRPETPVPHSIYLCMSTARWAPPSSPTPSTTSATSSTATPAR